MAITWAVARRWRLSRQYLLDGAADATEVVGRLTTIPAWAGDPELAVALRLAKPSPSAVEMALADGRLIRTYSFRGSTHFMRPQDAGMILALRAAGRQWERKSWQDHYGLSAADWPHLRRTVREALAAGPLTQTELADAVTADSRYAHLGPALTAASHTFLKPFAWQGDLALGPSRGGKVTFLALEGHPGWSSPSDLDESGRRAILGYLGAYGPATADRLHYWFGEGLSAGHQRIERWIREISEWTTYLNVDGDRALCLAEHADDIASTPAAGSVILLPGYDQWVLGPGTGDTRVVAAQLRPLVTRGANLVLVDGVVGGIWTIKKHRLHIGLPSENAVDCSLLVPAVERLASFVSQADLDVVINTCSWRTCSSSECDARCARGGRGSPTCSRAPRYCDVVRKPVAQRSLFSTAQSSGLESARLDHARSGRNAVIGQCALLA